MKALSMRKVQSAIYEAGLGVNICKYNGRYTMIYRGVQYHTEIRCLWYGQIEWWVEQARMYRDAYHKAQV